MFVFNLRHRAGARVLAVAAVLAFTLTAVAQRTREGGDPDRGRQQERDRDKDKATTVIPERTESGKTLVVPADEASKGKVYYVISGKDAQITFNSDAPLEKIEGTSNQVVGYVVVAEKEGQPFDIVAGAFRLPVDSLKTGIPERDEHLRGSQWLDASPHPDITYSITNVTKPKEAKAEDEFATYSARIVGMMAIRGVEDKLVTPARITLMPESDKTRTQASGDLMAIRCTFKVKLKDYDVDVVANAKGKVSNSIAIDAFLTLSTGNPDASGDADSTGEAPPEARP